MTTREPDWKEKKARRELGYLRRETAKARCMVCGERVQIEDRCSDGNYLHRHCAYEVMQR